MKNIGMCAVLLFSCQTFAMNDNSILSNDQQVQIAIKDLSQRLEPSGVTEITLMSSQNITWPSGALGCPKPNMQYTQALVPGRLIILSAGDKTYRYHAKQERSPFYCAGKFAQSPSLPDSAL